MNALPALTTYQNLDIAAPVSKEDMMQQFLNNQDVKPSSKSLYGRTLRQYFAWVDAKGLQHGSITRINILQYKEDLLAGGHSPLTVGSYLTAVRKFYAWAEANRYYLNVAAGIKTPKKNQVFEKEVLTGSQTKELNTYYRNKLTDTTAAAVRDYAIVTLIQLTGLRTIEVARANVGDMAIRNERRVLLIQGKGRDSKDQLVVLTEAAYNAITAYLSARVGAKAGEPLFLSNSNNNRGKRLTTRHISGLVKEGLRAIGLDDRRYTCHSLRHSVGTMIYTKTGRLDDVQIALRHSSPATSQIYARKAMLNAAIDNSPLELIKDIFN
jgi:integrase/recombinase XerD